VRWGGSVKTQGALGVASSARGRGAARAALPILGHRQAATPHGARLPSVQLPLLRAAIQRAERPGFNDLQYPIGIVLLAVLWRLRYKLGFRDIAELLLTRGYEATHETIRGWEARFAPLLADSSAPSDAGRRADRGTSTRPT